MCLPIMIKFWSIEYVDVEGEQCVSHVHLTTNQAEELLNEFCKFNIKAEMHDLTPPQAVDQQIAAVLSQDETKRIMGRSS